MADNRQYHLWIPEQEIDSIDKSPTGRSNQYDVEHSEHGQKLSQGLKSVVDFFQHLQSSSSLDENDLITFKVILQDKEDLASQKDFIENEGLTINAVKDHRHAIVSAPRDVFNNLQGRVDRYKEKGTKKDFQYIQEFEPFTAEDKKATSVLQYVKNNPDAVSIDVQVVLLPDMAPDVQQRAESNISDRIRAGKGIIHNEPYRLSDGTSIIRASMSPQNVDKIADDPRVYWVERTLFFHGIQPSIVSPLSGGLQLDPNIDISALPAVVVLDDGVSLPDHLQDIVPVHWQASGCLKGSSFGSHGTLVSSRVTFGYLGMHLADPYLTPRARIIDAQIADADSVPEDTMLKRVREAVENFSGVSKIFNFSYNASEPIEGTEMSLLGSEFDLLSRKYGVRFIISAGNHNLFESQDSLKDIVAEDLSQIASPADAMLGVTVGAIVGVDHPRSLSKKNELAPYSRRGPGFYGFYKPDLVAYGATQFKNGNIPPDPYALCLSQTGYCAPAGTSFTAPIVAGDLAQVMTVVPNNDVGLAQALLYNRVIPPYDRTGMTQEEMDLAGNLYGRGLPSPENSMYSSEDRVTFLNSGTMNRLTKKRVKFHIPSAIADLKVKRGEKKIRVTVTCIARPPVDRTKGSEYSAAYISASIHRLNSNGVNVVDNPSVSDNRNKWDTCYHFSNEFSSFDSGSWEVWLELFTRWGIADDEEIPYSLVITVEDLTSAGNLYSEIVRETAGRFSAVQPVRINIR
ncbi:S8 family peptidase [uncultured Mitsuokella sp.]|uniref:S8 family peptidase n=1 Tax=uncultured Mitsuokella sp. TaxID=453120 RepID=UPI0026311156|nr:S8 family peptidase [uncultured Mitsuokella sp.]